LTHAQSGPVPAPQTCIRKARANASFFWKRRICLGYLAHLLGLARRGGKTAELPRSLLIS
jgi:hypothetical protein